MTSEPVVVLYKSNSCRHCVELSKVWDSGSDSVVASLRKINARVRVYVVTAQDNGGKFDETMFPRDLLKYGKWYPMILAIPGRSWDNAMSKLSQPVKLEGVHIMNGTMDNDQPTYVHKYDIKKPSEFGRWFKDILADGTFNHQVVPLAQVQTIQPKRYDLPPVDPPSTVCSMKIISRPK